jgi:broad specificity phosphatase PhoE
MLTVRFIRHGESVANAGGITSDVSSIPLTPFGRAQALQLSQSFAAAPALIITSPYLRARDTAEPTRVRFPATPLEVWPVQEFTYLALDRFANTTSVERQPWAAEFWDRADPHRIEGAGTESYGQMIGRARAALERLAQREASPVAIFSHGTFLKAVHWEIENASHAITPETMRAFRAFNVAAPIANAEGFLAHWDGAAWRVEV